METVPSSGFSIPQITLKSVVFPAPFGPTRPTLSPGRRRKSPLLNMTRSPKATRMLERFTMQPAQAGSAFTTAIMCSTVSMLTSAWMMWAGAIR